MHKILIVDDSKMIRKALQHELADGDYEFFEAENGKIALEKIAEVEPDLITLDIDMPVMNGFETCQELRHKGIEINGVLKKISTPVIFISSKDTEKDRKNGIEAGGMDFVLKPFVKGEVSTTVKRLLEPPRHTLKGLTALVVDDSKGARFLISNALKDEGTSVIEAEDGLMAYDLLKIIKNKVDIIITDNYMPEMNGIDFCKKVRNELGIRDIPIIFLSGMLEENSISEIFNAGATDYLSKPFIKEELVTRIIMHLRNIQLQRELNDRVTELKGLNKIKDSVLEIASHDLRSPLSGIISSATILLMEDWVTENEEALTWITNIKASGYKLLDLLNEILDISRIQSLNFELKYEELEPNKILLDSVEDLKPMAIPKRITFDINLDDSIPNITSDKNALQRIFNNLISNAVKFTEQKGKITINSGFDKNNIFFDIKDDGIGIPEDKIDILFEKFTKSSRVGTAGENSTGLGMSIVKDLVEKLDGKISVKSKENEGTAFKISFPVDKEN